MAMKYPKFDADLRAFFDSALDAMFIIDCDCRCLDVNPAGCAMLGYTREECLSSDISLLLFPEDVKISFDLARSNWGRSVFVPEHRMKKKAGGAVWIEFTMSALKIAGGEYCLYTMRDVTEKRHSRMERQQAIEAVEAEVRKKTLELQKANESLRGEINGRERLETEFKKTTDLFHAIMDNSSMAVIFLKDINGKYVFANKWYEELFRIDKASLYGKTDYDLFPKEQADAFRLNDSQVVAAKRPIEFEELVLHPDGTLHKYITIKFPIPSMPGAVCGIATDITERARTMEYLKISEQRLKTAQRIGHMGSWEWNIIDNKLEWSDEIYRIFGLTPREFGATYEAFMNSVHPDDREFVKKSVHAAIFKKEPYAIDHRVMRPDGTVRTIHEQGEVVFDTRGNASLMAGTVHDVTELRRMEAEIHKAQKLEAIGNLAGGIAHDFNNILMGVLGNVSIAKKTLSPSGRTLSILDDIEKAALRAKSLTRQLLTFSKGGEPVKDTVQMSDLITTSAKLIFKNTGVECKLSLPDGLDSVDIDEGQISQVFNNIFLNAAHATAQGGSVSVSAENVSVSSGEVPPLDAGRYVRIAVKDSGTGIAKENVGRVFEPFFTTKQKASGLGLAVSYSIIKKHAGHIGVESAEGDGAAFYVYLPSITGAQSAPAKEADDTPMVKNRGNAAMGRILVMDDEEIVRDVSGEMLRLLGYEVEFANDGKEAVDMYKEAMGRAEPFTGIIMDLTIPGGMGGREALKFILEINPKAKVIVSSGYSSDPIMGDFRSFGFCGVISKPYRVAEFGRIVKSIFSSEA